MSFISWEIVVAFVAGLGIGWAAKILLDQRKPTPSLPKVDIEPAIETLQTQYAVCHNAHVELEGVIASLKNCTTPCTAYANDSIRSSPHSMKIPQMSKREKPLTQMGLLFEIITKS